MARCSRLKSYLGVLSGKQGRMKQDKKLFLELGQPRSRWSTIACYLPVCAPPQLTTWGKFPQGRALRTRQKIGQTLKQLLLPPLCFHSNWLGDANSNIQRPPRQTPGTQSRGETQLQGTKNTWLSAISLHQRPQGTRRQHSTQRFQPTTAGMFCRPNAERLGAEFPTTATKRKHGPPKWAAP